MWSRVLCDMFYVIWSIKYNRFELDDAQSENATLKAKQRDYEEALIKSDGKFYFLLVRYHVILVLKDCC